MTKKNAGNLSSKEDATHANGDNGDGEAPVGWDKGDENDEERDSSGGKGQWAADTPAESAEDEVLESRLWVLEISPTGLIDTPRPSNVS